MTLLASPVAYFHSLWLEYRRVASGKREWSWRQSAFQLSSVVFRNALWWKGRASVHRTMSLTILNNKDGVKKNGRNTGSCWASERKERALFPCCSGKTSGRRWWLAQCLQDELDLSLQGEQDFPLCARLGWWDDSGGMGQPGWMIFEGWREQINLPWRNRRKDWKYRKCKLHASSWHYGEMQWMEHIRVLIFKSFFNFLFYIGV